MSSASGASVFDALFPGGPHDASPAVLSLLVVLLLTVAVAVAGRKGWALSVRRALFFFLLLALLSLGSSVLPPEVLGAARPGLLVAAQLLFWVGLVECAQALFVDLILVGWLKRPPAPRILRDFVTLAFALTVFLLSLRGTLGVNLSSLIATSAMISVVLGLALQDTLGSFFAGLALQMEAPLAIGDWVQLGDSLGRVSQVNWRTVRVVGIEGDEITIPNSLLTRSTLTNYSRPTPAHMCHLDVRIHYRHPPNLVIAAMTDAMRDTAEVLADPPIHALVWEYADSCIIYRARYWINEFHRLRHIRSKVGVNIWYRLRREGIENAYPVFVHRRDAPVEDAGDRVSSALLKVDILGPLSDQERKGLASRLRPRFYGRDETIIRQGELGDSLFVILRGRVEVRVASAGQEGVVSALGAGSFFGEMSLLTGAPRRASVRALEDVEVVVVTASAFRQIVAGNPAVLEAVTAVVSSRQTRLEAAIQQAESEAANRSLAHYDLLSKVRQFFGV